MLPILSTDAPPLVRATRRVEEDTRLDGLVAELRPVADALLADPKRDYLLRGLWLGHALHPLMTMGPIGLWTSAVVLDLCGGRRSRPAAQRLLGLGLLLALPTSVTGLAEWGAVDGPREQRVGVVHAAANSVALGLFAMSYRARRADRHRRGVVLALGGLAAAGVGGFFGGHLTEARKVSSRHPVFGR